MDGQARVAEWIEPVTTDHKIRFDSFLARYLGRVHGYSPGCLSAHKSPLHVELGSSGGPHHGERSSHQYSPMNIPMRTMKPKATSIKAASMIASAITKRLLIVVTEAHYVAVTGASGSL
jgi:hypothetical protein